MTPDKPPIQPDYYIPHQHAVTGRPTDAEYDEVPYYYDSMPTYSGHEHNGIPISDEQWPIFQAKLAEINAKFSHEEPVTKPNDLLDSTEAVIEALDAQCEKTVAQTATGVLVAEQGLAELKRDFDEITQAERRAYSDMQNIFIGDVVPSTPPSFENIGALALAFAANRQAFYDAQI